MITSERMNSPLAVFVSLSLLVAPVAGFAQSRCDCVASTCVPTRGVGAVLRGRISQAEGRDANGLVERYVALTVTTPACAEFEGAEDPRERRASRATTLQLIITDAALRERLRALVGQEVTLRGVAVEQISAHHHTPLLLADVTLEPDAHPPTGAAPRVVTGPHASALVAALRRVRGVTATRAGAVSVSAFRCVEQGVGAGYDREISGPPPPPTYTCEGGVSARAAIARGLWRAIASTGVERDCAMGGRCELIVGDVACRRDARAMRCEIGNNEPVASQ